MDDGAATRGFRPRSASTSISAAPSSGLAGTSTAAAAAATSSTGFYSSGFEPRFSQTLPSGRGLDSTTSSSTATTTTTGAGGRRQSIAFNDPTLNRSDPYGSTARSRRSSAAVAPEPGAVQLAANPYHHQEAGGRQAHIAVDTTAGSASGAFSPAARRQSVASPAGSIQALASPPRRTSVRDQSPLPSSPVAFSTPNSPAAALSTSGRLTPAASSPLNANLSRTLPSSPGSLGPIAATTADAGARRRSSSASVSQVEVDPTRRSSRSEPPSGAQHSTMSSSGLAAALAGGGGGKRSFVPVEDVISEQFMKDYMPSPPPGGGVSSPPPPSTSTAAFNLAQNIMTGLNSLATKTLGEAATGVTEIQQAGADMLTTTNGHKVKSLEQVIKHEVNSTMGWRDRGSYTCLMSAPRECHGYSVYWVSFSKNGQYLVSGGHDGHVKLWNTSDMSLRRDYVGHTSVVLQCFFIEEEKFIISAAVEEVIVWYAENPPRGLSNIRFSIVNLKGVNTIAVSPNGHTLVIAGQDRVVRVWDLPASMEMSGTLLRSPQFAENSAFRTHILPTQPETGHTDRIVRAVFSPNNLQLLTCSFDKTIILWDVRKGNGQPIRVYQGHNDHVLGLCWHESGQMFASSSHDGTIIIWRVDLLVPVHVLRGGHESIVYACHYLPDSNRLLTLGNDGRMVVWNTLTGGIVTTIQHVQGGAKTCVAMDQLGLHLAVAASDKYHPVTLWKVERPPPAWRLAVKWLCFWIPDLLNGMKSSLRDRSIVHTLPAELKFVEATVEQKEKAVQAKNQKQYRREVLIAPTMSSSP